MASTSAVGVAGAAVSTSSPADVALAAAAVGDTEAVLAALKDGVEASYQVCRRMRSAPLAKEFSHVAVLHRWCAHASPRVWLVHVRFCTNRRMCVGSILRSHQTCVAKQRRVGYIYLLHFYTI
jgi:hypothetical protein